MQILQQAENKDPSLLLHRAHCQCFAGKLFPLASSGKGSISEVSQTFSLKLELIIPNMPTTRVIKNINVKNPQTSFMKFMSPLSIYSTSGRCGIMSF